MKTLKKIFLLLLPVITVIACSANKGTVISGTLKGAENMSVFLDQVHITTQPQPLFQEKADANGKFTFKFPEGAKRGIYRLRVGEQVADLMIDGNEKEVTITGNLSDLNEFKYEVKGAPLAEEYLKAVNDYISQKMDVTALTEFTGKTSNPLVGLQLTGRLFGMQGDYVSLYKEVYNRLNTTYPDLDLTKEYGTFIGQIEQQALAKLAMQKIKVGEAAPEISLPDPKGKVRKLSDYKGKVVLIDFWASWCGPCRKANPGVVALYQKYKDKGFDVFSVSLDGIDSNTARRFSDPGQLKEQMDASKQRWIDAIQQDQLTWDGHVSDLKKWESEAGREYGVQSIPQTFLVGRDGKIVSINPKGNLEEEILKFL